MLINTFDLSSWLECLPSPPFLCSPSTLPTTQLDPPEGGCGLTTGKATLVPSLQLLLHQEETILPHRDWELWSDGWAKLQKTVVAYERSGFSFSLNREPESGLMGSDLCVSVFQFTELLSHNGGEVTWFQQLPRRPRKEQERDPEVHQEGVDSPRWAAASWLWGGKPECHHPHTGWEQTLRAIENILLWVLRVMGAWLGTDDSGTNTWLWRSSVPGRMLQTSVKWVLLTSTHTHSKHTSSWWK